MSKTLQKETNSWKKEIKIEGIAISDWQLPSVRGNLVEVQLTLGENLKR